MKTLHKIFHDGLLKKYSIIVFVTICSLITILKLSDLKDKNDILSVVYTISFVAATMGPLAILFMNNSFIVNIKFLINQHFNRSELLIFFVCTQLFKAILCVINYAILYTVLYLVVGSKVYGILFQKIEGLYSTYFFIYCLVLISILIFNIVILIGGNKLDLHTAKISKGNLKLRKMEVALYGFGLLISLYLILGLKVPLIILASGFCFGCSLVFLHQLNFSFKLFHYKKSIYFSSIVSLFVCTPLIYLFLGIKNEIKDSALDYKLRAKSVAYLDWLGPKLSEKEMLGFLSNTDDIYYGNLLELFENKISFNSSLLAVSNNFRAKKFIHLHLKTMPQEKVKMIVNHLSSLISDKGSDDKLIRFSQVFFSKQKMNDDYINELVSSDSAFKQMASLYFAMNTYDKQKYIEFYNLNSPFLDKNILRDVNIKRSIASEN